ncbi:MAG: type II toxin-antitoxin system VapC family toxin [Acidobacteriota bacterium]
MRLTDALSGVTKLGLDTAPFIYFIESNPAYLALMREVMRLIDSQTLAACCSVITLTEVLTRPLQTGDVALAEQYRDILLNTCSLTVLPIDSTIAERAAKLRADYRLRTPDALQIAAALEYGCEAFLCNDNNMRRVADLRILLLDELEI